MSLYYTATDHFVLLPALLLALFGCVALLFDFLKLQEAVERKWLLLFSLTGFAFTGLALWRQFSYLQEQGDPQLIAFQGALVLDRFALFFNALFLAASIIVALTSFRFLRLDRAPNGEYFGLLFFAQCGMYFLAAGTDLVTLFVGLELMSLCFYVLVGFSRGDRRSNEAAMKYLLLGAFSTAFLLYGFSLLYGLTGSTQITAIRNGLAESSGPIAVLAVATTTVGLLFKVAAVPFHMWAPDVYEGAPTPVTAYLAAASKAASFALLLRVLLVALEPLAPLWRPFVLAVAVASLVLGNLAPIRQTNVKRLLAYSSIGHAGYILLGLVAANDTGYRGIAVYLLVYTFASLGAFLLISDLSRESARMEDIEDFTGLIHTRPAHAIWMLIFLTSLAGLPPTAGFLGKYYIFLALIENGSYALAVLAALYVAVALYYYYRVVRVMFAGAPAQETPSIGFASRLSLGLSGALTLAIGLYPEPFLQFANLFGVRD